MRRSLTTYCQESLRRLEPRAESSPDDSRNLHRTAIKPTRSYNSRSQVDSLKPFAELWLRRSLRISAVHIKASHLRRCRGHFEVRTVEGDSSAGRCGRTAERTTTRPAHHCCARDWRIS